MRNKIVKALCTLPANRWTVRIARSGENLLRYLQGKGTGAFSFEVEAQIAAHLLPNRGFVVVDVGANKGQWFRSLMRFAHHKSGRILLTSARGLTLSLLAA